MEQSYGDFWHCLDGSLLSKGFACPDRIRGPRRWPPSAGQLRAPPISIPLIRTIQFVDEYIGSGWFIIDLVFRTARSKVYVPGPEEWKARMAPWASGRRDEILAAMRSHYSKLEVGRTTDFVVLPLLESAADLSSRRVDVRLGPASLCYQENRRWILDFGVDLLSPPVRYVVYLPSSSSWGARVPDWARDRRDDIVGEIKRRLSEQPIEYQEF